MGYLPSTEICYYPTEVVLIWIIIIIVSNEHCCWSHGTSLYTLFKHLIPQHLPHPSIVRIDLPSVRRVAKCRRVLGDVGSPRKICGKTNGKFFFSFFSRVAISHLFSNANWYCFIFIAHFARLTARIISSERKICDILQVVAVSVQIRLLTLVKAGHHYIPQHQQTLFLNQVLSVPPKCSLKRLKPQFCFFKKILFFTLCPLCSNSRLLDRVGPPHALHNAHRILLTPHCVEVSRSPSWCHAMHSNVILSPLTSLHSSPLLHTPCWSTWPPYIYPTTSPP